jgi:hypothetical protein
MIKRTPGKKVIHHDPLKIYSKPERMRDPKEGLVIGMPKPKNERAASLITFSAT